MRAPAQKKSATKTGAKKTAQRIASPGISARLLGHITLEAQGDGTIAAYFDGYAVGLGKFSAEAAARAQGLSTGLALGSFPADGTPMDKEIHLLVRRLARRGLLEYRLGTAGNDKDRVVIEPQIADYWPQTSALEDADVIVLSRFAYLRRRGNDMVLESPRAGALFRICDPNIAVALAMLSSPRQIKQFRKQNGFPGAEILGLLMDCQIVFKLGALGGDGLRPSEGGDALVLWDFHDLLFHTHSTAGRQANPLGGLYPYADTMPAPPAVRAPWPGKKIDLVKLAKAPSETTSPVARLLRARHSIRDFDDQQPITLTELAQFLDGAARVQSKWKGRIDDDGGGPEVSYATRPYPSGGSAYELELYLSVANCEGLARGFYHYDADRHALVPIDTGAAALDAQLAAAEFAIDAPGLPQILITIAARFDRTAWKYSSIAYSLVLKDAGVLTQTLYLMATDMGLGGCAIGSIDIDLFAKMTGLEFHIEGPVGQFALGRGRKTESPD